MKGFKLFWRSKVLEIVGGVLLLSSYVIQNFYFDILTDHSQDLTQAILEQAVVDKSVLLNEIGYFVANEGIDSLSFNDVTNLKRSYISEAARKTGYSVAINIGASDLSDEVKQSLKKDVLSKSSKVDDLRSFSNYLTFINTISNSYEPPGEIYHRISRQRELARMRFLGLNLLGSVILLLGLAIKKEN